MNRFKNKKKAGKDAESVDSRPSLETDNSFSLFRRGGKKAPEQETKAEIDLALALPSNDDFRTSLLMSGLSARFSMLREQDDPTSKIGKASDDSVLFPKRHSRFDFGLANNNNNLEDIAEVESLRAPPFLRKDSSASNESGGMMTRSRPLESNVLFGGRQKVYKIPAGASSSKNVGDGMSGRALYDDDVAMSAFQKWRQTEKEKDPALAGGQEDAEHAMNDEDRGIEENSFITRAESPLPQGYNQKRETSSTTSSTPSGGRNSTAATSVISQSHTASQEPQTQHTAASAVSTPNIERHVTRTRKLYEQGLTQNLQEQQHSVLTRVDTLARRTGGARTPDLGPNTPSPTTQTFTDRWAAFGGDRRTVLTKASAPNLRSLSPPATGSLNGTMNLDTRVATDTKPGHCASPPLSPPFSDASAAEQPAFPTATRATNMFHKTIPVHDDARFAARPFQPQSGRQTPVQRLQDESEYTSGPRSHSVASNRRQEVDAGIPIVSSPPQTSVPEPPSEATTYNEPFESPILNEHVFQAPTSPEVRLERPSDQDHPAFRGAPPQAADEQHLLPNSVFLSPGSQKSTLSDSPTLGPNTGLGGMVRHHLRSESDVSSIYAPHSDTYQSPPQRQDEDQKSNYGSPESEDQAPTCAKMNVLPRVEEVSTALQTSQQSSSEDPRSPDEEDQFAEQLANARRRVRERLTSYVEPESASFSPPTIAAPTADLPPPPIRSNPLGILKVKSSRGSLVDRGRETIPPPIKELDGGYDSESRLNEEEKAHPSLRAFRQARREVQQRKDLENMAISASQNGRPIMPGAAEPMPAEYGGRRGTVRTPSVERQRMPPSAHHPYHPMRDNSPQHTSQLPPRSMSRAQRERSGSENSEGSGRSRSRPPNMRERPDFHHQNQHMSPEIPGIPPRHHMMRPPMAPGGPDMRRSPHMPPINAFQSNHRPNNAAPYHDGNGHHPMPHMRGPPERSMTGPMPSGPFPLSPPTGRYDPSRATFQPHPGPGSAPSTPSMRPLRRPSIPSNTPLNGGNVSSLNDAMRRPVNKRDISEPTFVMSTSRVPTTHLPASAPETPANRSRSGSFADTGASPPPLPPVNPRRRRDSSRTRTIMGELTRSRRSDEADGSGAFSASTPQLPLANPHMAPFARAPEESRVSVFDEDDVKTARRRLRKASPEMKMEMRAASSASKRANSPQVNIGQPTAVMTGMRSGGPSPNLPGGMF